MYIHIIQTLAKFAKHRNIDLNELRQLRLQNIHTTYIVNFVGFVCFSLFWFDMRNLYITFV